MKLEGSKLLQLFQSLSVKELKEVGKAVDSPFFNKRKEEQRLYAYLHKHRAKLEQLSLEDMYVFVFGKEKFSLPKLRHVMSYLTQIIERCIAIMEFENQQEIRNLVYAQTLRKRNLDKLFLAEYRKSENYLNDAAALSPDLYFYQLQLHMEYYSHSIERRSAENENLQKLSEDLDAFYVIQKLKQVCNILSYKNMFQLNHQPEMIDEVLDLIKRKAMLEDPLVSLFYYSYLCLSIPEDESNFPELKQRLFENVKKIELRELKDIFTLAINYCIKRLNTGDKKYYSQVFDIYKLGIEHAIFEEGGYLSPFTYKNISSIAIGLEEYKWVNSFIEGYKEKLKLSYRNDFYTYCFARYNFALGRYEGVVDLLYEVEIKEKFTDLDARVLLVKAYYELDEFNLLDYCISNLKQQIKRKKLNTYHFNAYQNFTKMIAWLVNLQPYDKKRKQELIKRLKNEKVVAEKEWLRSKL